MLWRSLSLLESIDLLVSIELIQLMLQLEHLLNIDLVLLLLLRTEQPKLLELLVQSSILKGIVQLLNAVLLLRSWLNLLKE